MPETSLPERILCLVTALNPGQDSTPLLAKVRAAVKGGVNMVQVRGPELERTAFFDLAAAAMETIGDEVLVVINNRVDVALAVDAGGVHIGERGPAVNAARRVGGDEWQIGRSVNSAEDAIQAQSDGADYLVLGPLFGTNSIAGPRGAGLELIREVKAAVDIPIIGTGGISLEQVGAVVSAGARGVAVGSAILSAVDPERVAAEIREAIENAEPAGDFPDD